MNYEKQLKEMIAKELEVSIDDVKFISDFKMDLGADSLDIIELTMEIEQKFDIDISENEMKNIRAVKDLLKMVNKKIK